MMVYYKGRHGQRLIADLFLESFYKTKDKQENETLSLLKSTSQWREDMSIELNW